VSELIRTAVFWPFLQLRLDQLPLEESEPIALPSHANIRGADYYQQLLSAKGDNLDAYPTNLGSLTRMKLQGMADALQHQVEQPHLHQLLFEDRFALLVDAEHAYRDQSRIKRLLRQAQFRQQASLEDIDWRAGRGLDRSLMATLAACDWILNLILTGASKFWIAEACGRTACRNWLSVRYERTHRFAGSSPSGAC
jgi:DNA replication protein DnaC